MAEEVNDALRAAASKSTLGKVAASEELSGATIIAAIGGVRGLIESILPSFVFLIVYLITKDVVLSALIPVAVSVIFVVLRVVQKMAVGPAVTGAVGVAITAALAIATNKAENNFVPGILINAAGFLAMLVSIAVRWPLVGVIVSLLLGDDAAQWRTTPREKRVLTWVTWIWVAMFAIRLAVEVPLYLAANAAGLAVAKLILGVPLYAVVLWISFILVRSIYPPKPKDS